MVDPRIQEVRLRGRIRWMSCLVKNKAMPTPYFERLHVMLESSINGYTSSEHCPLTEAQRKELCAMMGRAYIEIRRLGWYEGKAEQAGSLADAFHNVPCEMWMSHFSLLVLRDSYLLPYQKKYPEECRCDFVSWADKIISMHDE